MNFIEEFEKQIIHKQSDAKILTDEIVEKMNNVKYINERLKKAYIYAVQLEYEEKNEFVCRGTNRKK